MYKKNKLVEATRKFLTEEEAKLVVRGFDVVGDIAVVKIPEALGKRRFTVAEAFLDEIPSIHVVLNQASPVEGRYRVRKLEWLAGEERTTTIHQEYGCLYKVDLAKVYFSPRLSHERIRIAKLICSEILEETVINMFAGVGPFSILIAKRHPIVKIYSIDINAEAVKLHLENCMLNKVVGKVTVIQGDAGDIIRERLADTADRVLMPLPEIALESLDAAAQALKDKGWIHVYLHTPYEEDEKEALRKSVEMVEARLKPLGVRIVKISPHRVREVGTRLLQVAIDAKVEKKPA